MRSISAQKFTVLAALAGLLFADFAVAEIEEFVTTVRKRAESLQDVPISVSAFSGAEIDRKGITSLADIAKFTPGVLVTGNFSPQDIRVVMRGLSPTRGRPNVAVLQDGVDISSEAVQTAGGSLLINPRLYDLERIEVVKGPQSALYGRSAFAGAINYVTRKPGDKLDGSVFVDFGSQGQQELRGAVSGPVVADQLSLGINGAYWSHDGFHKNSVTGADIGGSEGYGVAGTALWTPTENLTFNLRAEFTDDEFEVAPWVTILAETDVLPPQPDAVAAGIISPLITGVPVLSGTLPSGDSLVSAQSEDPRTGADYEGTTREIFRTALTAEWDVGRVILKSKTHIASADVSQLHDVRRVGSASQVLTNSMGEFVSGFGQVDFSTETDLFSQEFTVASNDAGDSAISWLVGGLWWNEEVDQLDGGYNCLLGGFIGPPFPFMPCGPTMAQIGPVFPINPFPWKRDTEHWSVFGLITVNFLEQFAATFEIRYTDETTDVSGPDGTRAFFSNDPFFGFMVPASIPGSIDDDFVTPKLTLEWTPNEAAMYYFSVAKGVKPAGITTLTGGVGGFNPDASKFEAEEIIVWELGGKTSWLDDRLRLNGAVFYQDFTDKQTSTLVNVEVSPGVFLNALRPVNASAAEIFGVELDVLWQPTDALSLSLGYTFLDTEYDDFQINSTGAAEITQVGNCVPVDVDGDMAVDACRIDRSGNELPDAPAHSLFAGIGYRNQLVRDFEWFVEADVVYQDERFVTDDNIRSYDSYSLTDFRLGVVNDTWEVVGYVDNVFDDDTIKSGVAFLEPFKTTFFPVALIPNAVVATIPVERSYGVRLRYRFGNGR